MTYCDVYLSLNSDFICHFKHYIYGWSKALSQLESLGTTTSHSPCWSWNHRGKWVGENIAKHAVGDQSRGGSRAALRSIIILFLPRFFCPVVLLISISLFFLAFVCNDLFVFCGNCYECTMYYHYIWNSDFFTRVFQNTLQPFMQHFCPAKLCNFLQDSPHLHKYMCAGHPSGTILG